MIQIAADVGDQTVVSVWIIRNTCAQADVIGILSLPQGKVAGSRTAREGSDAGQATMDGGGRLEPGFDGDLVAGLQSAIEGRLSFS